MLRNFGIMVVTAIAVVDGFASTTRGDVAALRSLQANSPNILLHYTFEGNELERLTDTAGVEDRHLEIVVGRNGGDASNIAFAQGFDSSTTAVTPDRTHETIGAALRANDNPDTEEDNLSIPQTLTVELLFQPSSQLPVYDPVDEDDFAYAVNTRIWPLRRGYYLAQDGDGNVVTVIGRNFTSGRRVLIPSDEVQEDSWYYYAITLNATDPQLDLDPDEFAFPAGSDTEVEAYLANLTAGETTLTQLLDETITGGFSGPKNSSSSGNLGIGIFEQNSTAPDNGDKQFWDGALDEIAFYNTILSANDLQAHLDALLAPGGVAGDYNGNGVVDAADYTVWFDSHGQTGGGLAADGNGDLLVDRGDYIYWANRFGNGQAGGSAVQAIIPEPPSAMLCLAGVLIVVGLLVTSGPVNAPLIRGSRCRAGPISRFRGQSSVMRGPRSTTYA